MSDTHALLSDYDAEDIIEKDRRHVWHHLLQHKIHEEQDPKIFVEGQGVRVTDIHGVEYLDASSGGVWCVNVGYGRESMAKVIHDQLLKLPYYAGVAGTVPAAQFADKLTDLLPGLDRVFFANSGSEANEKAFKIVRQIAHRIAVMYAGRIVELGETDQVIGEPLHPYTQALMASARGEGFTSGEVANPAHLPSGCYFHPRCSLAKDVAGGIRSDCLADYPEFREIDDGRWVACHFVGERKTHE